MHQESQFEEAHGQKPARVEEPRTPTKACGFLQNQTPSRDPFESITSPHNLRVLLKESELMKETLQKDLARAKDQVQMRDEHISKLENEIEALNARINKQEITIWNQSKTIQDPRSYPMLFPHSLRERRAFEGPLAVQTTSVQAWQTMHPFLPTPPGLRMTTQQSLSHTHPPVPFSTSHQGFVLTSGQRGSDSIAGENLKRVFEPIVAPTMESTSPVKWAQQHAQLKWRHVSNCATGDTAGTFQASPYAGFEFEMKATEFGGRFRSLWAKAEKFAKSYTNNGEEVHPNELSVDLQEHMMISNDVEVAVQYLNNPVTKSLYVAKAINVYLCRKIFKLAEVVRGFDDTVDIEIVDAKKRLVQDISSAGISPIERHVLLSRIADQVVLARSNPKFAEFNQSDGDAHAFQLQLLLDPLLLHQDKDFTSYKPLLEIIRESQIIALDLQSCPYELSFHFPRINELYDPTCMMNMNVNFDITQIHNSRVKMAMTPFVRLALYHYDPPRERNVGNAKVFTYLPGSEDEPHIGLTPGHMSKLVGI